MDSLWWKIPIENGWLENPITWFRGTPVPPAFQETSSKDTRSIKVIRIPLRPPTTLPKLEDWKPNLIGWQKGGLVWWSGDIPSVSLGRALDHPAASSCQVLKNREIQLVSMTFLPARWSIITFRRKNAWKWQKPLYDSPKYPQKKYPQQMAYSYRSFHFWPKFAQKIQGIYPQVLWLYSSPPLPHGTTLVLVHWRA